MRCPLLSPLSPCRALLRSGSGPPLPLGGGVRGGGRSLIVYDFPFSACALRVEDAGIASTALARRAARRIQCGGERNTTFRLAGVAERYTRQSQKLLPFTGLWVRIPPPAPLQLHIISGPLITL